MQQNFSDLNFLSISSQKIALVSLFDVTILSNRQILHQRTKSGDREVPNFSLADVVVADAFFSFRVVINKTLFTNLLDFFLLLVDFNDFTLFDIFNWLLFTHLLHVCNFLWTNLVL